MENLNRGNEIKLTLWGSVVNQIEDNFFTENPGPFIIIATCLTVKTFWEWELVWGPERLN